MDKQTVYVVIISGEYVGVAATFGQACELLPNGDVDYLIMPQVIFP